MVDDHITFPAAHSIKLSCLQSKQYHIIFQVSLFKNLSPCIRCEKTKEVSLDRKGFHSRLLLKALKSPSHSLFVASR